MPDAAQRQPVERTKSLQLPYWCVGLDGWDSFEVSAATAAAARYIVFKRAREAGYFSHRGGFRDFLTRVSHTWRMSHRPTDIYVVDEDEIPF